MKKKKINLALQGGGAHGAFTWGVLDRLLDEDWLEISGVSGTSAGALNGAALKAGLACGAGAAGRQAARRNLEHVWSEVGKVSDNRMVRWLYSVFPAPRALERVTEMLSPVAWIEQATRMFSPYDYGVFYSNPLRAVIDSMPHPRICAEGGPMLFVNATNVRTGQGRVFANGEVTTDAVLASACLPTIYRAIRIEDPLTGRSESYWDGGYSGNPALFPLFRSDLPRDIVIVNINPMHREDVPRTPTAIQDRINEVSFNAALLSELRAINFVKHLHSEDRLQGRPMKNVLMHMILDDKLMNDLNARSKILPKPGLLSAMKEAGQHAANGFIEQCADAINERDTVDFSSLFPRATLNTALMNPRA
ncbi:MAG: patatin-like phospholipase family protein, partial [Paracoccus sp. (in: a-proteobacteria)]|nr:patatin-like phospholipase family protein [Paracoccus sp. (in: a-proteobacteria)]